MSKNKSFEIVLLGDARVGKTSLLKRFVEDTYLETYDPTIGTDVFSKHIQKTDADIETLLQCWDTTGQETFANIINTFIPGKDAALLVFDPTNKRSFINLQKYWERTKALMRADTLIILVSTKSDKPDKTVSLEEIETFCKAHDNIKYLATSAANDEGITKVFTYVVDHFVDHFREKSITAVDMAPPSAPPEADTGEQIAKVMGVLVITLGASCAQFFSSVGIGIAAGAWSGSFNLALHAFAGMAASSAGPMLALTIAAAVIGLLAGSIAAWLFFSQSTDEEENNNSSVLCG